MLPVFSSGQQMVPATMMMEEISRAGALSGLKLCLDASDINSWPGSGQKWLDLSGNGYDFFRGATSSSEGSDPTFNGTAGQQTSSEYWSFDGGDFFRYDTSNEAWMNNLHKNNAAFTIAGYIYASDITPSVAHFLAGTARGNNSNIGIALLIRTNSTLRLGIANGSGLDALTITSRATFVQSQWNFFAVTVNEAAGTGTLQVNGTQEARSTTYTSPSSSSASYALEVGAAGDGAFPAESGFRMANFCAWEAVALTATQLDSLYQHTKAKFGH